MPILLELHQLVVIIILEVLVVKGAQYRRQLDPGCFPLDETAVIWRPTQRLLVKRLHGGGLHLDIGSQLHLNLHAVKLLEAQIAPAVGPRIGFDRLLYRLDHPVLQNIGAARDFLLVSLHLGVEFVEGVFVAVGGWL